MADTKISALASGVPAVTTDLIPIARGTANYSLTAASLLAQTGSLLQVGSTAVGIGTSSPATFLDVSYSGGMARFGGASNNNMVQVTSAQTLGMWAGGNSQIYSSVGLIFLVGATTGTGAPTGGTQTMTLGTNGAVTLAGSSTSASLTVNNAATLNASAIVVSTAGAGNTGIAGVQVSDGVTTSVYGYTVGTSHFVGTSTSHALGFITGNVSRATISNTGNVTINAPTSGTALTVGGTGASVVLNGATAHTITQVPYGLTIQTSADLSASTGDVGVYLSAPYNTGTANTGILRVKRGTSNTYNGMEIGTTSSQPFRIIVNSATEDTGVVMTFPTTGGYLPQQFTVATLPAAASNKGALAIVSDATLAYTSTNVGTTVVGSGSNTVPVFCNGTNWVIG